MDDTEAAGLASDVEDNWAGFHRLIRTRRLDPTNSTCGRVGRVLLKGYFCSNLGGTLLPTLRLNDSQGDPVGATPGVQRLRRTVERLGLGRHHVDELAADPLPSGHTSRRWGSAIKHPDGRVELDPDPWPA